MTPAQREILDTVAFRHGVRVSDLVSESRRRLIARARQEAMYALRMDGRWSTPMIGRVLGCRDHSTVVYGADVHAIRSGLPPLTATATNRLNVKRLGIAGMTGRAA